MGLDKKRIFVIEDNVANRAIAQMLLEREGAAVAFERWGTDVLNRLKRFLPVDLILLDLMFPNGITGYDIFKQIQADEALAHIPVVAVSASDPYVAVAKTQELGFRGFIAKPVDFNLFTKQIERILDGEEIWDSSENY